MMTENHWKQLEHHHLRFMHQPWLDQTIYIMINDVVLAAIIASESLEGTGHIGAAVQLTMFQQELKRSWKTLSQRPLSGQDYGTNIQNWTCQCGAQQFQPQHLCKHLVQLVTVNPDFFAQLNQQQTMPIYENPALGNSVSDAKGSISAGNDFLWMGRHGDLSNGKWQLIVDPGTSSGIRHSCSPSLEYGPQNKKASFKKKPFISVMHRSPEYRKRANESQTLPSF